MTAHRTTETSTLEAAVYRKVTWRLLPFLMLCYGVAYLDRVASFTPATALAHASTYTAALATGIADLAGNATAAPYQWSFTTLAWAAKARITAIGAFVTLETAFTIIQWLIVGLVTAAVV